MLQAPRCGMLPCAAALPRRQPASARGSTPRALSGVEAAPSSASPEPPAQLSESDEPRRRGRRQLRAKGPPVGPFGGKGASVWRGSSGDAAATEASSDGSLPELSDGPLPPVFEPEVVAPGEAADASGGALLARLRAVQRAEAASTAAAAAAAPPAVSRRSRARSGDAAVSSESAGEDEAEPAQRRAYQPTALESLRSKFRERRERSLSRVRSQFAGTGENDGNTLFGGGELDEVTPGAAAAGKVAAAEAGMSNAINWRSLQVGEFVVHKQYGVGQYLGCRKLPPRTDAQPEDYLFIKFADQTAKLRASSASRLLYRYRSAGDVDGKPPKLSALNDPSTWAKRQARGRIAIRRLVNSLMDVYLERVLITRPVYPSPPPEQQTAFDKAFPYPLTTDQAAAVEDLDADMSRDTPMDRLVIGDVGFGKTEVAMYAALRCLAAGRQVAVLAPTTVLAKQHAELFSRRFEPLGYKCASLTRYTTANQRKEVVLGLADGSVRLVSGTHALISEAEHCQTLGLLIVDEEQRFGVRHKEAIQALHSRLDVLTLSATPIPRTLHMALAGFRDTSIIASPPPGRRPIDTIMSLFDETLVVNAITAELARGGQVFYVVPRVESFAPKLDRLMRLMPGLRVRGAHGRMRSGELEDVMSSFGDGEFDVLLCTTIVESGLDLPRVNTIVIEDVHMLGLSSLYQLRGRVGRSNIQAHALLLWSKETVLSSETTQRLDAIKESCGLLGQGFRIAERDMAIRGVGAVFGDRQSGVDGAGMGVDLYLEMLYEQLQTVEGQQLPTVAWDDVELRLPLRGFVPHTLVSSEADAKLLEHRCVAAGKAGPSQLKALAGEVEAATGVQLPKPLHSLLRAHLLRWYCAELGVHAVSAPEVGVIRIHSTMTRPTFECISGLLPEAEQNVVRWVREGKDGGFELRVTVLPSEHMAWSMQPDMQVERAIATLSALHASTPKYLKYV